MTEVSLHELLHPHPVFATDIRDGLPRATSVWHHRSPRYPMRSSRCRCSAGRSAATAVSSGRWSLSARWCCCWRSVLPVQNLAARNNAMLPIDLAAADGAWRDQRLAAAGAAMWTAITPPIVRGRMSDMTRAGHLVGLYRQAVHWCGDGYAAGVCRGWWRCSISSNCCDAPRLEAGRNLRHGQRDCGVASALYRDAGAAVRRVAWRHAVLLASDAFVGADRRPRRPACPPGSSSPHQRCAHCLFGASRRWGSARCLRRCSAAPKLEDNLYLKTGGWPLGLTGDQLWLRQSDRAALAAGCRHHPCAWCWSCMASS